MIEARNDKTIDTPIWNNKKKTSSMCACII